MAELGNSARGVGRGPLRQPPISIVEPKRKSGGRLEKQSFRNFGVHFGNCWNELLCHFHSRYWKISGSYMRPFAANCR